MRGGTGNDQLLGGTGRDVFVFQAGDGTDRIKDFDPTQDVLRFEGLTDVKLTAGNGSGAVVTYDGGRIVLEGVNLTDFFPSGLVFGGSLGNRAVIGGPGADSLCGGGGNDTLRGGDGNDEICGDGGDDRIFGNAGNDTLSGNDGVDRIFGGLGDDEIKGDNGNDTLKGEAGQDTLRGGTGNDQLFGGAEADIFVFQAGDGTDRIRDFDPTMDILRFEGLTDVKVMAGNGNGAVVTYDGGRIVLEGIDIANVDPADFVFA